MFAHHIAVCERFARPIVTRHSLRMCCSICARISTVGEEDSNACYGLRCGLGGGLRCRRDMFSAVSTCCKHLKRRCGGGWGAKMNIFIDVINWARTHPTPCARDDEVYAHVYSHIPYE